MLKRPTNQPWIDDDPSSLPSRRLFSATKKPQPGFIHLLCFFIDLPGLFVRCLWTNPCWKTRAAYVEPPLKTKWDAGWFNHLGGFIKKKLHGISSMKKKDSEFIQDGYFQVIFRASSCPYPILLVKILQ